MICRREFAAAWTLARHRGPRFCRSSLLLLLGFVVAFAQFAATNHELTTRHAICAEHGELIDVHGADTSLTAATSGQTQLLAPGKPDSQNHHQHCIFKTARNHRTAFVLAKGTVIRIPHVSQRAAVLQGETCQPAVARYMLAPKHSPPTA